MYLKTLVLALALGTAYCDDLQKSIDEIQSRNEGEVFNRNKAGINERQKKIDTHFGGIGRSRANDATMQAFNERVKMDYDRRGESHAGSSRNLAKADIGGNNNAAIMGYGNSGGAAFANKKHGNMRLSKDSSGEDHVDFTGQGRSEIKTEALKDDRGKLDKFTAGGEGMGAAIDPTKVTDGEHQGGLFFKNDGQGRRSDEFWLYEVHKDRKDVDATITDQSQGSASSADQSFLQRLFGQSNQKKFVCKAQKVGESICYDQNGKTVGKTVATDDGKVVIYNKYNLPVGRGQIKKDSNNKYVAHIDEGLMQATTSDIKYYDCMNEFGKRPSDKIKLRKPIHFVYNSEQNGGEIKYQFPDCFEVGGRVELARGVDADRVATEFVVNILPAGKLRCMDTATCGRECYYCDYCQKKHKLDILDTVDGNVCSAEGGQTVDMKVTVCPPPESFNMALCSKFSKSLVEDDYWKKKGDIDVQMRFYLRPENRDALVKKFYDEMNNPLLGRTAKSLLKLEWASKYSLKTGSSQVTDSELLEFYIKKNGKEELIGCERALIDYKLGGDKVDGSFLIESAALAGGFPSVFQQKPCKDWTDLDQQQFDAEMAAAAGGNSGSSSSSVWSKIFGRGGK